MERNIFSAVKKRLRLPSSGELLYILKNFSQKERVTFSILTVIFLSTAVVLLWKANNYISITVPGEGGELMEGIVGTPRSLNPLLAISDADRDMASLIYSGLMRSDNKGGLMLDLTEKYEISEDGLEYTFTLKPDLEWSDGEKLTSDDIVFTIQQTTDPILKSPRRASWEGVDVVKIDDCTVKFILQKPYAPFLENTTIGIMPKHLWKDASSELMALSDLNIKSIGSGPFKIKDVNRDSSGIITSYTLIPNAKFALGKPYIKKLVVKFFSSETKMIDAFRKGEINSLGAVPPQIINELQLKDSKLKVFSLPRVFGLFFNQNNSKIFTQKEVHDALTTGTNREKIVQEVLKGFGIELNNAIPPGSFGALEDNEKNEFSLEKAKSILEKNGWSLNENGIMEKKIKKETITFEFSISTSNIPELKQVAEILKSTWEQLGAKIDIKVFEIGDLNQNVIRPRKYDALLFGEIVGRDPDPFVFWHSSQRNDPGLNIALYTNPSVDKILEKARTVSDENERKDLYKKFQEEMKRDLPAVFLYSPYYIYIVPRELKGIDEEISTTIPSERFSQIYKWYMDTDRVWKIFSR
ncbi:MAG: peptide ABC transporter substrate-binding protein [Patescibacteria group bacterium]